jgi:NAD-dependent dihydropyrimidine dehydrogenase PreA subunit
VEVVVAGRAFVLVSRQLGDDAARASLEDDLARRLVDSGHTVIMTPHIYHLPHGSDVWDELARTDGPLSVVGWSSPRALTCLVREYAGLEPQSAIDLSAVETAEAPAAALRETLESAEGSGEIRVLDAEVAGRWYPVIDRTRCTSCRHCLQFCLFGVYETRDRRVVPVKPDNCKDGCPACARVCPEGAIIFPLSDEPAIAGEPGTIMQPDAAARRMYYVRTGKTCPVCGRVAEAGELSESADTAATCEECGGPLDETAPAEASVVHEEIDSLIDALDDLAAGGGSE